MSTDPYHNTGPDTIDEQDGPAFDADAALDFLYRTASPLEHARLAHWRGGDPDGKGLWRALHRYQNPDGGWCRGIDPDYTGEVSSIQSTIEAFRILVVHGQSDDTRVQRSVQFLRQNQQPDHTWCELDGVMAAGAPPWYGPAGLSVWETAMLAGYALELGFTDFWGAAAQYVKSQFNALGNQVPHPYWATILLLGRSKNDDDEAIVAESIDVLTRFAERERIDPYDCSWIIEIISILQVPNSESLLLHLGDKLAACQQNDGGVASEYGAQLRPKATFNALMAIAAVHQFAE